jgi:uncharacterized surface anchored protein
LAGTRWGSGEVGSFSILKTDPEETPLAGSRLSVYRVKADGTEVFLGTLSTRDDGTTTLENLRYFTYRLQKIESPEGYLLPRGE